MVLKTKRIGKGPISSEQEQLEQMIKNREESMARMSSLVEILVQNQSQPLLLTDAEQADVLRERLQAEREKAAADLATGGSNTADREDDSADGSDSETRNPRSQRNVSARKSATHTGGMQPPVVQPEARDLPLM